MKNKAVVNLNGDDNSPNICKILNVRVGSLFTYEGSRPIRITDAGAIIYHDRNEYIPCELLCKILNHPDKIVFYPRLNQDILTFCSLLGVNYITRDSLGEHAYSVGLWKLRPLFLDGRFIPSADGIHADTAPIGYLNTTLFKDIESEACISVLEETKVGV